MTTFVIEHNGTEITGWRYEADDDYTAGGGELVAPDGVHHNNIDAHTLDTNTTPTSVVEDTDYVPPTQRYHDAKAAGDLEKMADALFELVTGNPP